MDFLPVPLFSHFSLCVASSFVPDFSSRITFHGRNRLLQSFFPNRLWESIRWSRLEDKYSFYQIVRDINVNLIRGISNWVGWNSDNMWPGSVPRNNIGIVSNPPMLVNLSLPVCSSEPMLRSGYLHGNLPCILSLHLLQQNNNALEKSILINTSK